MKKAQYEIKYVLSWKSSKASLAELKNKNMELKTSRMGDTRGIHHGYKQPAVVVANTIDKSPKTVKLYFSFQRV